MPPHTRRPSYWEPHITPTGNKAGFVDLPSSASYVPQNSLQNTFNESWFSCAVNLFAHTHTSLFLYQVVYMLCVLCYFNQLHVYMVEFTGCINTRQWLRGHWIRWSPTALDWLAALDLFQSLQLNGLAAFDIFQSLQLNGLAAFLQSLYLNSHLTVPLAK
jgi:hypothetical protein